MKKTIIETIKHNKTVFQFTSFDTNLIKSWMPLNFTNYTIKQTMYFQNLCFIN